MAQYEPPFSQTACEPTDEDFLAVLQRPEIYALATQTHPVPGSPRPREITNLVNHAKTPSNDIQAAQQRRRKIISNINRALANWQPTLPQTTPDHCTVPSGPTNSSNDSNSNLRSPSCSGFFDRQRLNRHEVNKPSSGQPKFTPDLYQAAAMAAASAGHSFFLTGSAGTGKSFVLKQIIRQLRLQGKNVAVTASTGCAAVGVGGSTIHSMTSVGLGLDPIERLRSKGRRDRRVRDRFQKLDTLVIDEVSMIDSFLFDKIEAVIKAARDPGMGLVGSSGLKRRRIDVFQKGTPYSNVPFGGLQVIVCGDFFQLPPVSVSEYGHQNSNIKYFAFESKAWKEAIQKTFVLRVVHRQGDRKFVGLLNEIRQGVVSGWTKRVIDACSIGYGKREEAEENSERVFFTKLYSFRKQVATENDTQLRKLRCRGVRFVAQDLISRSNLGTLTVNIAKQMLENGATCLPSVELKTDCRVLCVKNIDTANGICNGAAGKVVGWCLPYPILCSRRKIRNKGNIATEYNSLDLDEEDVMQLDHKEIQEYLDSLGVRTGEIVLPCDTTHCISPVVVFDQHLVSGKKRYCMMSPATWEVNGIHGQVIASRTQVPLILGWALSIHKSQGMTLEDVETDVGNAFDYGQVYVALSRATSIQKLRLKTFDARRVKTHEKVVRFYRELEQKEAQKDAQHLSEDSD